MPALAEQSATVIFLDLTGTNRKDGQDWACPDVI
jgi:hypothetical protein